MFSYVDYLRASDITKKREWQHMLERAKRYLNYVSAIQRLNASRNPQFSGWSGEGYVESPIQTAKIMMFQKYFVPRGTERGEEAKKQLAKEIGQKISKMSEDRINKPILDDDIRRYKYLTRKYHLYDYLEPFAKSILYS